MGVYLGVSLEKCNMIDFLRRWSVVEIEWNHGIQQHIVRLQEKQGIFFFYFRSFCYKKLKHQKYVKYLY